MTFDWWQLGWGLAGLFLVLFVASIIGRRGLVKQGAEQGYHERQHWETDQIVKGKLERQ